MRALVIDDSRAMRMLLKTVLQPMGYTVIEAGNGQEGLDRLKANGGPFELGLVDWNMPVMNGLEFVQAARGDRANDAMKLVMVTTEVETSQITRALEAGANEYVMKPFTREALQEKLAMLNVSAIAA
jgi:two-component system chemotaxis response regulator CheY